MNVDIKYYIHSFISFMATNTSKQNILNVHDLLTTFANTYFFLKATVGELGKKISYLLINYLMLIRINCTK